MADVNNYTPSSFLFSFFILSGTREIILSLIHGNDRNFLIIRKTGYLHIVYTQAIFLKIIKSKTIRKEINGGNAQRQSDPDRTDPANKIEQEKK